MVPPNQRLAADECAVPHIHLGLEMGVELPFEQGNLQPSLQFALQQRCLPHLLVIKDNGLHRLLGVPARVVGKIQHAVHIELFRPAHQINAEYRDNPAGAATRPAPSRFLLCAHAEIPNRNSAPAG